MGRRAACRGDARVIGARLRQVSEEDQVALVTHYIASVSAISVPGVSCPRPGQSDVKGKQKDPRHHHRDGGGLSAPLHEGCRPALGKYRSSGVAAR
jgi:hypothetical protein